MHVRCEAESLTCCSSSHLLLRFESNGPHRHRRVTLSPSKAAGPPPGTRAALRSALRARRRAVPAAERFAAAQAAARQAGRGFTLRAGRRVAVYAATPQELDTTALIALARRRGCRVYVPRIDRQRLGRRMRFVELAGPLRRNHLGILEPQGARFIPARWLDAVFLPLVGFDRRGVRLGMGGGYYDRAFAFRRYRRSWHAPRLIGFAWSFQEATAIEAAPHDVLLDAVVTERGWIDCRGARACSTG